MSFTRLIPDLDGWNDRIAAGGSPETLPPHPEPRLDVESIEIPACGFSLPEHEDVPAEDAELLFRTRAVSYTSNQDEDPLPAGTTENSLDETTATTYERHYDGTAEACATRVIATAYSNDSVTSYIMPDEVSTTGSESHASSSSSLSSACSGTQTSRSYALGPWFAETYDDTTSDPYNTCPLIDLTPDASYSYAGYVFSKSQTVTDAGFTTEQLGTITYTLLTPEHLQEDLAALNFPDDANGETPSSAILADPENPDLLTGARKAAFKVGVPDGYTKPYFKAKWDFVFYPAAWLAWDEADPETRGPEPTPAPSLVGSGEWERITSGTWSDLKAIPIPTAPGEVRIRNLASLGYRSRWGSKYTYWGDRWFPPP